MVIIEATFLRPAVGSELGAPGAETGCPSGSTTAESGSLLAVLLGLGGRRAALRLSAAGSRLLRTRAVARPAAWLVVAAGGLRARLCALGRLPAGDLLGLVRALNRNRDRAVAARRRLGLRQMELEHAV